MAEQIVLEDLKRVQVRPGDAFIVRVPRGEMLYDDNGRSMTELFTAPLEEAFPGHRVAVIEGDVEVAVVGPDES